MKYDDKFKPEESGEAFLKVPYRWLKFLTLPEALVLSEFQTTQRLARVKRPYKSVADLAQSLSMSDRTIQRAIRGLESKKIIHQVGVSQMGCAKYEINLLKIGG